MKVISNYNTHQEKSQGNDISTPVFSGKNRDLMDTITEPTFAEEYELALKIGNACFGSPCPHTEVKDGVCLRCWRRVI